MHPGRHALRSTAENTRGTSVNVRKAAVSVLVAGCQLESDSPSDLLDFSGQLMDELHCGKVRTSGFGGRRR